MTNYNVKTVDAFIKASSKESQPHMKELRALIKSVAKDAEEVISYGKPFYKLNGHLVGFDTYKKHIGFEVYYGQLTQEHKEALVKKGYSTGNKTVQIKFDEAIPSSIIKKIISHQIKVNGDRIKKK